MAKGTNDPATTQLMRRRIGGWAGVIGPTLFVAIFTIEGWLRPGYQPTRMFVSALSLGPRGWIQIVSFLICGTSFLLFARGLAAEFPDGKASRAGPILLGIVGVCLFGSGPFVMDPGDAPFPDMTLHSQVHHVLGAIVFSLGPASTFVLLRRFRADPGWHSLQTWTLVAGIVMVVAVVLLKIATLPPPAPPSGLHPWAGLIQRLLIVPLMAWIAMIGWTMVRRANLPSH
jgi:hypothetical membrane protein